jgi:hypothetical protein
MGSHSDTLAWSDMTNNGIWWELKEEVHSSIQSYLFVLDPVLYGGT